MRNRYSSAVIFDVDGPLLDLTVEADGTIEAQYDNGESVVLGALALATFPAQTGLDKVGGNLYQQTIGSGDPAMGRAGEGGRGQTIGYSLERSNVDLEEEFVQMIQAQRAYQANSGVIRASDQSLQVLTNLV